MSSNLISKTFQLLRAFTDQKDEWGVNELSRYLDIPVSSVHRMMLILKKENILEYSQYTRKYKVGRDWIRMSSIISTNVDLRKIARPHLEALANVLHHSVYLAIYCPRDKKMAFIDRVKSSFALQYVFEVGVLKPVYMAASGKNILAHLPMEEIHQIMELEKQSVTEELLNELQLIKSQGYAKTINERKTGALSIGAPIFDASKEVIGSIICVIPVGDFVKEEERRYIESIMKSAANISDLLGYSG